MRTNKGVCLVWIRVLPLILVVAFSACSKSSSPTAPSDPTATATRIISIGGDLVFGHVEVGSTKTLTLSVTNNGNSPLAVTSINGPSGIIGAFSGNGIAGSIASGATRTIPIVFSPTEAKPYEGVLRVVCDCTSGNTGFNVSAAGARSGPLWTMSGVGDSVFDMPTYVTKVRVVGTYTRNSSNFIVRVAGRLLVNELIGTGWSSTTYDGTLVTTGGQVAITSSSGVSWSFTEVR